MSETTRDRLIDTAMGLFLERGYEATGVKEILRRAEVNSGSMYHYFPRKLDLLLAVLERYRALLEPVVIRPVFERTSDPIERVFGVLEGYRQMLLSTAFEAGCPIGNLALELGTRIESARLLIAENFENWRLVIRGCFEAAGARLPADVDRDGLATLVLTVMEGAVMQARSQKSIRPYDQSVASLRDYVERLLGDARGARDATA